MLCEGWYYCNDIEHIDYLPVMDFRNKSISVDVTSTDVNKAIQRAIKSYCYAWFRFIVVDKDIPAKPCSQHKFINVKSR